MSLIKPLDKFYSTIKARKQCVQSWIIAVALLSRDVFLRGLADFEKMDQKCKLG